MKETTYLKSLQPITKSMTYSYNIESIQKSLAIISQSSLLKSIKAMESYRPIMWDTLSHSLCLLSEQIKYIKDAIKVGVDAMQKIDWNFIQELNKYTKTMFADKINFSDIFYNTFFSQKFQENEKGEVRSETIISDSAIVTERVVKEPTLTRLEKRNWFVSFFRSLNKFFSSSLVGIVLFIISPIYNNIYNETIKPTYYHQEFRQLQQEKTELELRIIHRSTPLYREKRMKSQLTILYEYEIVVILDDSYGDRIKVQVYNTDYVGWIYKKYSSK